MGSVCQNSVVQLVSEVFVNLPIFEGGDIYETQSYQRVKLNLCLILIHARVLLVYD
jgi:hypothetical protein